jgi:hypothetical protein
MTDYANQSTEFDPSRVEFGFIGQKFTKTALSATDRSEYLLHGSGQLRRGISSRFYNRTPIVKSVKISPILRIRLRRVHSETTSESTLFRWSTQIIVLCPKLVISWSYVHFGYSWRLNSVHSRNTYFATGPTESAKCQEDIIGRCLNES